MWKKLALSLALLAPATPAWAFGIGTTLGVGSALTFGVPGAGPTLSSTAGGFLPSLDFHFGDVALQVHVLELLGGLSNEVFYVGANVYFGIPVGSVGKWDAVIAPGAGLDVYFEPFGLGITAESQFGITLPGAVSVGIYIVPAIGVWVLDGSVDLLTAGTLQWSIWFGAGGKGGRGTARSTGVGLGDAGEGV